MQHNHHFVLYIFNSKNPSISSLKTCNVLDGISSFTWSKIPSPLLFLSNLWRRLYPGIWNWATEKDLSSFGTDIIKESALLWASGRNESNYFSRSLYLVGLLYFFRIFQAIILKISERFMFIFPTFSHIFLHVSIFLTSCDSSSVFDLLYSLFPNSTVPEIIFTFQ